MESDQTNYTYDLGILTLHDSNPLKFNVSLTDEESKRKLEDHTLNNIRRLVQSLFSLKNKKDAEQDQIPDEYQVIDFNQSQFDVTLPQVTTAFPRHKKVPESKPMTRWEKFAQENGIQKRKRGRLVFDDITQTWVPRHGRGSIKQIQDSVDVVREVKPGDDPTADPFAKKKMEKKLEMEKQRLREIRNKAEAKGMKVKDLKKLEVRQEKIEQRKKENKNKKKENLKALRTAQLSTASMGLFDKKVHKEEPELRKKRKNTVPEFKSTKDERKRDLDILEMINKTGGSKKIEK